MMHARRTSIALAAGALAAAVALGGCGGSGSKSSTSQAQATTSTGANTSTSTSTSTSTGASTASQAFAISSPAVQGRGESAPIQTAYTCDGANTSPPVSWSNTPPGTSEVVVLMVHVGQRVLAVDWAVAGLDPSSGTLPANTVPSGAVLGRSSAGRNAYSLCPPKGKLVHYGLLAYALPQKLSVTNGFDPRKLIALAEKEPGKANASLGFAYKRP